MARKIRRLNGSVKIRGASRILAHLIAIAAIGVVNLARLVRSGDYAMLSALYDSVPEVLSELIRTAFVPRDGYKFIVSDFPLFEARVLRFWPESPGG